MSKKMKWVTVVMIVTLMVTAVLAGCGNKKDVDQNNSHSSNTQLKNGEKNEEVNTPSLEKVTFTYCPMNPAGEYSPDNSNETTIGKMIEDATGVNIKFDYVVGDRKTKAGVMIASGDYPDMIMGAWGTTPDFINAEAFIPLEDLIEEHGPNIKKLYSECWNRMKDPDDGHIYYLPAYPYQGDRNNRIWPEGGFRLQKAAVVELGFPKIETLDDYFSAIKQYKNANPTIEGQDAIGFLLWPGAFNGSLNSVSGYTTDGICFTDLETKEVIIREGSDEQYRYFKIANKWYNEGIIDPESFVMNRDQYKAKLTTGAVIGVVGADWEFGEVENTLKKSGKDERTWFPFAPKLDESVDEAFKNAKWIPAGEGVGITVKAKDPVRIIKFWDYLAQEEIQKLTNWGIEGEDYEVDENGRFYMTPDQLKKLTDNEYRAKKGLGQWGYGWPSGDGFYSDGNAWAPSTQPEVAMASFTELDKKILKAYNVTTPMELQGTELLIVKHHPLWNMKWEDGHPAVLVRTKVGDVFNKYWAKAIMAKPEEFENIWKEYVEELGKLDLDVLRDYMQKEVDRRYREW